MRDMTLEQRLFNVLCWQRRPFFYKTKNI